MYTSEWIKQQVDKTTHDIPTYWGRPTRTPPNIQAINTILNGQQPPPRGWNQPEQDPQ